MKTLVSTLLLSAALLLPTTASRIAHAEKHTLNACGCYGEANSCICSRKSKCGCPGECEPKGCEVERQKQLQKEIDAETKKAKEEELAREEREGAAVLTGLEHFQHVHFVDAEALGDLPNRGSSLKSVPSSPIALSTSAIRSWSPRGTRRVQTRSRKCRFSSPRMVGAAKPRKGIPRSGSKRSIAFSKPTLATWIRSSEGSAAAR